MLDLSVVNVIMAGALGLTVLGVTEIVKRFLKASGAVAYIVSLVVSAGATAYYLVSNHIFTVVLFIGYTLLVFATANGIFKATHTPTV
jgi:hypothetical protein